MLTGYTTIHNVYGSMPVLVFGTLTQYSDKVSSSSYLLHRKNTLDMIGGINLVSSVTGATV